MYKIIEIIIISLLGVLAIGFSVWYFFVANRKQNNCGNCNFCNFGKLNKSCNKISIFGSYKIREKPK